MSMNIFVKTTPGFAIPYNYLEINSRLGRLTDNSISLAASLKQRRQSGLKSGGSWI